MKPAGSGKVVLSAQSMLQTDAGYHAPEHCWKQVYLQSKTSCVPLLLEEEQCNAAPSRHLSAWFMREQLSENVFGGFGTIIRWVNEMFGSDSKYNISVKQNVSWRLLCLVVFLFFICNAGGCCSAEESLAREVISFVLFTSGITHLEHFEDRR